MEEIKATDLMIGNWFIGFDDKPFQWSLSEFAALENNIFIDELIKSPIALTEEILLKAGIKIDNNKNYWLSLDLDKHLDLIQSEGYYYPQLVQQPEMSMQDEDTVSLNRIASFHELQNLFKLLTGNDLKVEI